MNGMVKFVLATAVIVAGGSCAEDPTAPLEHRTESEAEAPGSLPAGGDFDALVSEPVEVPGLRTSRITASGTESSTSLASRILGADEPFSYVSLRPGSLPDSDSVRINNRRTDVAVTAVAVSGGFDPVPVPALVGDTLELLPFTARAALPGLDWEVPARRPPVVVRTQPPEGKTKVPLNSVVIIVFSEPISDDAEMIEAIRLLRDGHAVDADVAVTEDRFRVELRPDVPLSPGTEYTLLVSTDVRDLSGDALEQALTVTFSTDDATLTIAPESLSIAIGVRVQLVAQLTNASGGREALPPVTWSTSDPAVAAVTADGAVTGSGDGSATIVASVDGLDATADVTVISGGGLVFVELTAGRDHSCGLTTDGFALCWGSNEFGQLGDGAGGAGSGRLGPVLVAGDHVFTALAAGTHHTCGLAATGGVLCWGRNDLGQLGDGSLADRVVPTPVVGLDQYLALTAGLDHTCARPDESAVVRCWGRNIGSVLGSWTVAASPRRVETSGNLAWVPIDYHARREAIGRNWCPIFLNGGVAVLCWGQPPEGRLAIDLATLAISQPGGTHARTADFDIGGTICTVSRGGGAFCSSARFDGDNHDFGLGVEICDGGACAPRGFDVSYWYSRDRNIEQNRPDFVGTSLVVNGGIHSCALTLEGSAFCWGSGSRGQLGRVPTSLISERWGGEEVETPEPVVGGMTFATLAAGDAHTCGVGWNGETYCWGANGFGQLGDGSQVDRFAPVRVIIQE